MANMQTSGIEMTKAISSENKLLVNRYFWLSVIWSIIIYLFNLLMSLKMDDICMGIGFDEGVAKTAHKML